MKKNNQNVVEALSVIAAYKKTVSLYYYFGIPYSNDMDRIDSISSMDYKEVCTYPKIDYFNIPLMRNSE